MHELLAQARTAIASMRVRELGVGTERCPLCACRMQVRLRREETAIRCVQCRASAITQSLVAVLTRELPRLELADAYELSSRGALVTFLRRNCKSLVTSEYFDGVARGDVRGGVRCEDVQQLTFPDRIFDLCTSTEVFEHVEDDRLGFRELYRVLRPSGTLLFTVPLSGSDVTVERTELRSGVRINVLPPEYHTDHIRGSAVFCFRTYGRDVVDRLRQAGFAAAEIVRPPLSCFGFARSVVVARKGRSK